MEEKGKEVVMVKGMAEDPVEEEETWRRIGAEEEEEEGNDGSGVEE